MSEKITSIQAHLKNPTPLFKDSREHERFGKEYVYTAGRIETESYVLPEIRYYPARGRIVFQGYPAIEAGLSLREAVRKAPIYEGDEERGTTQRHRARAMINYVEVYRYSHTPYTSDDE